MHTSQNLCAEDFQYRLHQADEARVVDFDTLCPQYHMQDRVAVVSPHLEDGLLATSGALLALTTAFYDVLRAQTQEFFDYPQHFALVGGNAHGVRTQQGHQRLTHDDLGLPWRHLDVWPDSQWRQAPETVCGMLHTVCNLQINRLFWPETFRPQPSDQGLPWYAKRLLQARLKSVYYYHATLPNVTIHAAQNVAEIVQESRGRLETLTGVPMTPASGARSDDPRYPYVESMRLADTREFLQTMAPCFEARPE